MTAPCLDAMPRCVEERHHELNLAARECYRLRNAASDPDRAADLETVGDVYFGRALALTAEWEVDA